jgi:hypothetical protein
MRNRLIASAACVGLLLVAAPVAMATPGGGQSGSHSSSAVAKACAAAKKADRDALWGKHAMRECIRAGREAGGGEEGVTEATNAAQDCRAAQEADPAGFTTTWGTNGNQRNAFGKCVSATVQADDEAAA